VNRAALQEQHGSLRRASGVAELREIPCATGGTDGSRTRLLRRGERLEALSVGYNVAEGIIAIGAGIAAGSAALSGFGGDSLIEVTSAAVLWRRLRAERLGRATGREEEVERRASRWAGSLLLTLSAGILLGAGRQLFTGAAPAPSGIGIFLTTVSVVVMPFLAREKLRVAAALKSAAMRADAHEQVACAWLSGTTLAGLVLNAVLGWWWADPAAAVIMVPLIAKEGWEAWRGEEDEEGDEPEGAAGVQEKASEDGRSE
jgi:divalent metal cation (Fe/Co/Zn/Cd) transporter